MPVSVFMGLPKERVGTPAMLMLRAYGAGFQKTDPWGGPCIGFPLNLGPSQGAPLVHEMEEWIAEGCALLELDREKGFRLTLYGIPIDLGPEGYQAAPQDVIRVGYALRQGYRPWERVRTAMTEELGEGLPRIHSDGVMWWQVVRGSFTQQTASLRGAVCIARSLVQVSEDAKVAKAARATRYHRDPGV